jgi:drug/metabolite transporter (DMT)-like permease
VAEVRVSSSLTAVVVSSMPLWSVAFAALGREWPSRLEVAGLLVGLTGVVVLQQGGELRAEPIGLLLLIASTWCWAGGSMWSRRLPMASGLMASATEMLPGGLALVLVGLARGERLEAAPTPMAAGAWLYLVVFGSLVAFSAYNFLLRRVRPALATSYAYVNPAVAVGLGALAGEAVGWRHLGALALVLGGVGLVAASRRGG